MISRRLMMAQSMALLAAGCAPQIRSYSGPEVERVVVMKGRRRMYLLNAGKALKSYDVDLGFAPKGHKIRSGDGKTPEGQYWINRRNPDSIFHLSLGISYPNRADRARAKRLGVDPGGDIFIHGESPLNTVRGRDWTWGCIAVKNREMEEVYTMVRTGTPITIYA